MLNDIRIDIRINNINRIIIGHLNVNSSAEKYDSMTRIIPGNINVMVIGESKLDGSHPTSQFLIDGFSESFRHDRRLLLYVRGDILCRQLSKHSLAADIVGMFIKLNFRKSEWLLGDIYHPPNQESDFFLNVYDKVLLIGHFNAEENELVNFWTYI